MTAPLIPLRSGSSIPQIGFGTWAVSSADAPALVRTAVELGYRHVDTAAAYRNEEGVGEGLRSCGLPRAELFVTTKLWTADQGFDSTLAACAASLDRLGLEYLDLYLIHWPAPARGVYLDSWRAMIRLQDEGRIRAIGVSNFTPDQLERLAGETGVIPAVNQIECHPRFQQAALRAANARLGVVTESWSPLGLGHLLSDPALAAIAARHDRTPAQVVLRWHVQNGLVAIPKSSHTGRLRDNLAVFDFTLDEADMAALAAMDDPAGRTGPRVEDMN